jgi:hypothetical protein
MAVEAAEPNLFELSYGDVQITFSTSSFAGPPQFSHSGPRGQHTFSGEEIRTLESELGTEVTVTLESIPDLRTVTLTLVLPAFRLPAENESAFQTVAVFTTVSTTIAGPPPGADRTYEVVQLDGVARLVSF